MSIAGITLALSGVLTGLLAGIFFDFSITIIPSFRDLTDREHIKVMQIINLKIKNIPFLASFIGPAVLLPLNAYLYRETASFLILAVAAALYIVGVILITIMGNIPLNEWHDSKDISQLSDEDATSIRNIYHGVGSRWMILHNIRTLAAILALVLIFIAAFTQ